MWQGNLKRNRCICSSAHAALKELCEFGILLREIKSKIHIYSLNMSDRNVVEILKPAFEKEASFLDDVIKFVREKIKESSISTKLSSVLLYGSWQKGTAENSSDVDIAVIVEEAEDMKIIEDIFIDKISATFDSYFRNHLDVYIKTKVSLLND